MKAEPIPLIPREQKT